MRTVPVSQIKPPSPLAPPQVSCLPGESGAMYTRQRGEEVGVMSAEVVKDGLVLGNTQVLPNHFHAQHLTIRHRRLGASRSHPHPFQALCKGIVYMAKHRYNENVQVHCSPPIGTLSTPIVGEWTWLFNSHINLHIASVG